MTDKNETTITEVTKICGICGDKALGNEIWIKKKSLNFSSNDWIFLT